MSSKRSGEVDRVAAGAFPSPAKATRAHTVAELLDGLRRRNPPVAQRPADVFPTGFEPIDDVLNGGLRAHDLTLVAGAPGVGKTVAALQWARGMAIAGADVLYVCYEHTESDLLARLICLELAENADGKRVKAADKLQILAQEAATGARDIEELAETAPEIRLAIDRIAFYAARLHLLRAGGRTGLDELEHLVAARRDGPTALFVDYLQKVAISPEPADEAEKVLRIAEGLKELALSCDVAVIAVVAADRTGLEARRLRLHHMRGSTALAYESDVVLTFNEKLKAISKVHLAYDARRAATYKDYVVLTIEKNRGGPAYIDMEFRKDFAHYRFDPRGGYVAERLVDERLFEE